MKGIPENRIPTGRPLRPLSEPTRSWPLRLIATEVFGTYCRRVREVDLLVSIQVLVEEHCLWTALPSRSIRGDAKMPRNRLFLRSQHLLQHPQQGRILRFPPREPQALMAVAATCRCEDLRPAAGILL